ncbi:MAG: hypothetical protein OXD33_00870 [Rhodobacteraceae bacterium]|nr:hypothetical protein [Paracoccaceae bacterium]
MDKRYVTVERVSRLTGQRHRRAIEFGNAKMLDAFVDWEARAAARRPLIQQACPDLSADDREFLLNGITPDEWTLFFGDDDTDEKT